MTFSDIHIHALYGCDDGAKTLDQMQRITDRAYRSGTRLMCLTPHYHPGYFGNNREQSELAFEQLQQYAAEAYPDLRLYLGNELRWDNAAVRWLGEGHCRTMNGGRYVLVDFRDTQSRQTIETGLHRLLSAGYRPILAHVERYRSLQGSEQLLRSFRQKGIVLQMDAGAPFGRYGVLAKLWSRRLLKAGLIDLVCSDGHDTHDRVPDMDQIYAYLHSRFDQEYADRLCRRNAEELLCSDFGR